MSTDNQNPIVFRVLVVFVAVAVGILLWFSIWDSSESTYSGPPHLPPYKSIHQATEKGSVDDVRSFIEQGVDVNAKTEFGNWTPLHFAAGYASKVNTLKYLIENGADVNAKTDEGMTPLDIAVTEEIKTILRDAGGKRGDEL